MKIAAVIAEYNPFHNGHAYMFQKIRETTGADYILVVMSGDFTQRGIPGITDKFTRAKAAVSCGADAVFELPLLYSVSSAEGFAYGAVSLLHALSCVDFLVFGSECGELSPFLEISDFLLHEPDPFKKKLQQFQKLGFSYPKAFSLAVREEVPGAAVAFELLSSPNNLLGLEYVKAIKRLSSPILPVTLQRIGTGYHDTYVKYHPESGSTIASASAVRTLLSTTTGSISQAAPLMPADAYRIFAESYSVTAPMILDDFSLLLSYRLAFETKSSLITYLDVSDDLADRILKYKNEGLTFSEFADHLKHKQYTYSRILRALLHILLGIKKEDALFSQAPYARLLAMRREASPMMKKIKESTSIPLITKAADAKKVLNSDSMTLFSLDTTAADLYQKTASAKFHSAFVPDIKRKIELL